MSESRYSVEELKNIYGVTERTLKNWKKIKISLCWRSPHNTNMSIKMI